MDPKQLPSDMTEPELALYMIQNDVGMVIVNWDDEGNLVRYEERAVEEDEGSQTGDKQ